MAKRTTQADRSSSKFSREWIQLYIFIGATLFGAYQFVLKDIIRPAQEPTALDISASLVNVGEKDGLILLRTQITARNPTKKRVYIPALWYTVTAYRLSKTLAAVNRDHTSILESLGGDEFVSTYAPVDMAEVVAQQRIVYTNTAWWDPDDKTNDEFVFAVPKNKFDFVMLRVSYLHTRFQSDIEDPIWTASESGVWGAQFVLKPHVKMDVEQWQASTSSGYNWYTTALPLKMAK